KFTVIDIESLEHFLQNVRNGFMLKNAALDFLRKIPDLGNHGHGVGGEVFVAGAYRDLHHHPVEIALAKIEVLAPGLSHHSEIDCLTQQPGEVDRLAVLGYDYELEAKKLTEGFMSIEPFEKYCVRSQRCIYVKKPPRFGVAGH